MMTAKWLGSRACLVAAALLTWTGSACTAPSNGDDESLRTQVQKLNRLTGDDPVNGEFRLLLADVNGSKKLLGAAKAMVQKKPQAFSYYGAFILGQLAEELRDLAASESFFRVCIGQARKLQSSRKLSQSYLSLIALHYDNKQYEASAKVCQEFLELKAPAGKPRLYLLAAKTDEEPEPVFLELEDYDPVRRQKPGVHRLLIQAIARQGKHQEALKLANTLIKAHPGDWLDLQLKGWVLREAGDYQEAAKVHEDVLARIARDKELEPEERDRYTESNRYTLSNIFIELKKVDKAAEQLQALLAKKPDDPTYNNDLGYIWADNGMKLEEAEKLIRKALEEDRKRRQKEKEDDPKTKDDRDNGAYLDSLGWVLYKQKKYKEAKEVMLKAVEDKDSQHIEIYDHLGDVLWALQEKDKAIQAWKKGLELVGNSKRDQQRKAEVEAKLKERK
jgi:tetratricopeptide (TPR) repeat protein